MALVSYGASDDSDYSEDEDTNEGVVIVKNDAGKSNTAVSNSPKEDLNGHISDEEEFVNDSSEPNSIVFEEPSEPSILSLISKKLPQAKLNSKIKEKSTLADEKEDLSSIPAKKDYGDKVEEPPAKKKKKPDGPVKITIPSLEDLKDDEDEESKVKVKSQPSKQGSGLIGLLPKPKNFMAKAPRPSGPTPLTNNDVIKRDGSISFNNLKPQAVRKVGLVPHKVANPPKPVKPAPTKSTNSDSDSDDDLLGVGGTNSNSYFPAPTVHEPKSETAAAFVNPTPMASYPGLLPPTLPADPSFVSLDMGQDISSTGINYSELGPAVAPYPPPMPTDRSANQGGSLVDNEEAIRRLAGKQNKMKEFKDDDQAQFIEVKEDDMRGDPLVWMTKAMTEEKAPRPTGKGPKGLAKTRHQITYLAHQAKERDWELKQEWAQARENRRASANKYGFM